MRQLTPRDYYTTGEMARALGCSQQTVIRWIDSGKLKGHRLPGRQGERRCHKAVFRQFAVAHQVPPDRLDSLDQSLALASAFTTPKESARG
jgi:excisionase family DNA binding protein